MYKFKSCVILENEILVSPIYNESQSSLIDTKCIFDTDFAERNLFVKVSLIPPNGNILLDINSWIYSVNQTAVPDWYEKHAKRYEEKCRDEVKKWVDKNIISVCNVPCTKLKEENGNTYFHVCKPLFITSFGNNNDYRLSTLRSKLFSSDFAKALIREYGESLIPTSIDLTSQDGFRDYGILEGDLLAIPDINLYRECRKNIFCGDEWWWLSTPDSTNTGYSSSSVSVIGEHGCVRWRCSDASFGVRPFFIIKSDNV